MTSANYDNIEERIGTLPDIVIKQKDDSKNDIVPKEIDFSKGSFLVKKTE